MAYRYETHLHTCQASACGRSTGKEHARFYKDAGFQGIIITDHFFGGNTAVPRSLSWKERVEWFCSGYEDALIEGQKLGLDVFFGWEQGYAGDEYLVYGLDKAWLLSHPEVEHWTRGEQLRGVHEAGGCVIQAHPLREREYLSAILLAPQYADGIEVANAGNLPYNDALAHRYAEAYGLFTIAGSDNHYSTGLTSDRVFGIETDEKLTDMQDLARRIRARGDVRPVVPAGRFDSKQKPVLPTFWLDENEDRVPTGVLQFA